MNDIFEPMTRLIKSTMMVVAGLCWIGVALGFGFLLVQYLNQGAGLQVLGFYFGVSSTTVLLGLAHVVGLAAAAFLCFALGVVLCAHGLVPPQATTGSAETAAPATNEQPNF